MSLIQEQYEAASRFRAELRRGDWAVPVVEGPSEFVTCRKVHDDRHSTSIRHRFDRRCMYCPPNPETTPHDVDACRDEPCPACYDDRIAAAEAEADAREDR